MTDDTQPDPLQARGPLDGHRSALAARSSTEVRIAVLPGERHYNVRVNPDGAGGAALAGLLGRPVPARPSTWVDSDVGTVVWLGPDEWLVIDRAGGSDLEERLRAAVLGHGGAVVEQSGQRVSILVTGNAAGLLAKGTSIDLHPLAFPKGTAAQSFLGQTIVVLLARADDSSEIEILVRSSFARYLADWLVDAAGDPLVSP